MKDFFVEYFSEYENLIFSKNVLEDLILAKDLIEKTTNNNGKLYFAGNGASASIASHGAVDFSKQAKIPSITFHDPNLITCFSNDYGFDNWIAEAFKCFAKTSDTLILISVSGESQNVINAGNFAKEAGNNVITFTGKSETNTLKQIGDINFWVDSHAYNIVECIHMIWITSIIDSIIGKSVYSVS